MPFNQAALLMRKKLAICKLSAPLLYTYCRVIIELGAPKLQKLLIIN
jgi:hypothetical protein